MNLAQSGLNLDTDDLKQAGNLGSVSYTHLDVYKRQMPSKWRSSDRTTSCQWWANAGSVT